MSTDPLAPFLDALASYRAASDALVNHFDDFVERRVVPAYVEAVAQVKPHARLPDLTGLPGYEHHTRVRGWAVKALGADRVRALETGLVPDMDAERAERVDARDAAQDRLRKAARVAVFPATDQLVEVYSPGYGAYATQTDQNGYLRADCALRAAILQARGFRATVRTEPAERYGRPGRWWVEANAPPELKDALPYWHLDDERLLQVTHPANLKVLLSPIFPYAGAWDWPVAARETRDSPTFAVHRANEEAHLAVNGRTSS